MRRTLPIVFVGVDENNCGRNVIPRWIVYCLVGISLAEKNGGAWVSLDGLDGGWKVLVVAGTFGICLGLLLQRCVRASCLV